MRALRHDEDAAIGKTSRHSCPYALRVPWQQRCGRGEHTDAYAGVACACRSLECMGGGQRQFDARGAAADDAQLVGGCGKGAGLELRPKGKEVRQWLDREHVLGGPRVCEGGARDGRRERIEVRRTAGVE